MTTHLKSRNGSWNLDNKKNKNLFFEKPLLTIFEDSCENTYIIKNGKKTRNKSKLINVVNNQLKKGFYACGYFAYEYNQKTNTSSKYKAVFNIYKNFSTYYKQPSDKLNKKIELKKKTSDTNFISNVKKAKNYISEGDIYQINLSREFILNGILNPHKLFLDYYKMQPVEYAGFYDFHDHALISGSMELFIKKEGEKITTKPIKGTAQANSQDEKILKKNKKEISENLMIVDLMRNDLSQICRPGTVKTKKLFRKKLYSTLVQLESEVSGILKKNIKSDLIFSSLMPPGSVTGTPKSRSMEIINNLENHSRGPYCGALGYFTPSGDFCFSVGIRTLIVEKNFSKFYTGAGIVWDSNPKKENFETILKTKALRGSL